MFKLSQVVYQMQLYFRMQQDFSYKTDVNSYYSWQCLQSTSRLASFLAIISVTVFAVTFTTVNIQRNIVIEGETVTFTSPGRVSKI